MEKRERHFFNTNSNVYIIFYSAVLVVVVAFILAFVSQSLKARQDSNVATDKKKQILSAVNLRDLDNVAADSLYRKTVLADAVIDFNGKTIDAGLPGGENAGFTLSSTDYKEGRLALFVCSTENGVKYVVPVYGKGLWGAIWGYIAVNDDCETIYGAYFNHESETAGLGAEIKDNRAWQESFIGKKIYTSDGEDVVIAVKKPSEIKDKECEVDAVTGSTLTSNGVSLMLKECFLAYKSYFLSLKKGQNV